jgi:hypothetical protein
MSTRSVPGRGRPDPSLSAITSQRHALINLAYRMLGSLAEAEDAVQEAYARWYAMTRQQQQGIESPGACNRAVEGDPADRVTLDESVSMAFLVVLESMTPAAGRGWWAGRGSLPAPGPRCAAAGGPGRRR